MLVFILADLVIVIDPDARLVAARRCTFEGARANVVRPDSIWQTREHAVAISHMCCVRIVPGSRYTQKLTHRRLPGGTLMTPKLFAFLFAAAVPLAAQTPTDSEIRKILAERIDTAHQSAGIVVGVGRGRVCGQQFDAGGAARYRRGQLHRGRFGGHRCGAAGRAGAGPRAAGDQRRLGQEAGRGAEDVGAGVRRSGAGPSCGRYARSR